MVCICKIPGGHPPDPEESKAFYNPADYCAYPRLASHMVKTSAGLPKAKSPIRPPGILYHV
ncbi:hypothetical protein BDW75DRAFT_197257 [Aspergillus navahoensis]